MYERILVPQDGSDLALQALPYARTVSRATGAEVELLSVIEPIDAPARAQMREYVAVAAGGRPHWPTSDELARLQGERRNEAMKALDGMAESFVGARRAHCIVLEGDPAQAIIDRADERANTLIVMATHGRSGIGRWLLGSVTDTVVRHARQPTLVIRAREEPSPSAALLKSILLPLDGSGTAEAAIPHAVEMAKALDIGIKMLHATSLLPYATSNPDESPDLFNHWIEQRQTAAHEYLNGVVKRIRAEGVRDVSEETFAGDAGASILDELSGLGDRLVVMATHGRSGVGRWVLGSVTDRVVRHSHGPVLVVRPDESP